METEDQSLVQDDYIPERLDPSPVQDEYAPVVFSQETVSHIVSIDMMSGKVSPYLEACQIHVFVFTQLIYMQPPILVWHACEIQAAGQVGPFIFATFLNKPVCSPGV